MTTNWGNRWYESVGWALFSLRGRIRRSTFALGGLLLTAVLWFFIVQIVRAEEESGRQILWTLGFMACTAFATWSIFALTAKRLHDIGLSGWLSLLLFVPGAWVLAVIVLSILPGQAEDNVYGPVPVRESP